MDVIFFWSHFNIQGVSLKNNFHQPNRKQEFFQSAISSSAPRVWNKILLQQNLCTLKKYPNPKLRKK